jgi:Cd2+/Zn2+-exporting ATPase
MTEAAVRDDSTVSSILRITGMDCPDCAAKVEKAIKLMPGVIEAAVVFPIGRLNVLYDPQRTSITQMSDMVKKLGYEALDEGNKQLHGLCSQTGKTGKQFAGSRICPD